MGGASGYGLDICRGASHPHVSRVSRRCVRQSQYATDKTAPLERRPPCRLGHCSHLVRTVYRRTRLHRYSTHRQVILDVWLPIRLHRIRPHAPGRPLCAQIHVHLVSPHPALRRQARRAASLDRMAGVGPHDGTCGAVDSPALSGSDQRPSRLDGPLVELSLHFRLCRLRSHDGIGLV
jgi:hypothetical protein